VVSDDPSADIRECYQHAEECARLASDVTDPKIKQRFLGLKQRWLKMAKTYQTSEPAAAAE